MEILGYLMIAVLFASVFYLIYRSGGLKAAFGVFGVTAFVIAWVFTAVELVGL